MPTSISNTKKEEMKKTFINKIERKYGKTLKQSNNRERFGALAELARDFISEHWIESRNRPRKECSKQVYYFSIEFLMGRMLESYLTSLGIREICEEALSDLGVSLRELVDYEEDAGLGNGGLGRLAACYLDSMAALGVQGHGYGLRYRYGLFEQRIISGYQHEYPDNWLKDGFYVWEYRRPEEAVIVKFGGSVRVRSNGRTEYTLENYEPLLAVPYDVPITGHRNDHVNTLRLWSAEVPVAEHGCSLDRGCNGVVDYLHGVEAMTDTLYPDDTRYEGKILRLKQQYFLVSAGLQSILRHHLVNYDSLSMLPEKVAIHINDTHPSLAVPELMRLLMDEYGMGWDEAWHITTKTISYTNHTVLPEALEKWPEDFIKGLLPRVYMIIVEINERFCRSLWELYPGDWDRIARMAVIAEGQVRMAHLAIVGSYSVNGVARLHTEILKKEVMSDFYQLSPTKFSSITNGVTHRRWMLVANPLLAGLITDTIGPRWVEDPCRLKDLEKYARDAAFLDELHNIKTKNKLELAKYVRDHCGINLDVNSIFDSHIKRIHAYKRQSLNALHILHLYNCLRDDPGLEMPPRTFIFGGKAAPGYYKAKRTIKLINALADKINNDPAINGKIKVLFMENYNVSLAERIIPASDVSEQIPAASLEACGTGNMKFMMNGALILGTLDGANIEIRDSVGNDNIFIFGLTAEEVLSYYRYGGYNPWDIYHSDQRIKTVLDQLISGFLPAEKDDFRTHFDAFLPYGDRFFVLKDFASYVDAQKTIGERYRNRNEWQKMCVVNIARSGNFAGDRTFAEYSTGIWGMPSTGCVSKWLEYTLPIGQVVEDNQAGMLQQ